MSEARGGNKATYRKNNNRRGIYQPPGRRPRGERRRSREGTSLTPGGSLLRARRVLCACVFVACAHVAWCVTHGARRLMVGAGA